MLLQVEEWTIIYTKQILCQHRQVSIPVIHQYYLCIIQLVYYLTN